MEPDSILPPVFAGPILRRCTQTKIALWLAVRSPARVQLAFFPDNAEPVSLSLEPGSKQLTCLTVSPKLSYLLIDVELDQALPADCWVGYHLRLQLEDEEGEEWLDLAKLTPQLNYPGKDTPGFVLSSRVGSILHGSCRKPHHPGVDGLVEGDALLARCLAEGGPQTPEGGHESTGELPCWPSLLLMSGDQIYADDAAGPMLLAIHQLIRRLELPQELLPEMAQLGVHHSEHLYQHQYNFYHREQLLPQVKCDSLLSKVLPGSGRKPIFTSANAQNHLISAGEYLIVYLLVWSPIPWQLVDIQMPDYLQPKDQAQFSAEQQLMTQFVHGLAATRRLMAHLPVAMIFDDHDVSDDWNLNRDWETQVYEHPLSRQMIGNGLLAYLINQGWGNKPEVFSATLLAAIETALEAPGKQAHLDVVEQLLDFEQWDYDWATQPPLVVLDTRTRRWRSESSGIKPSGLIDWEALTDLQRCLRGHSAVLLASAAPIFGVKLIEVIQRIVTAFGKPLLVDAENWMAHPGTANGILNVFRHRKTPQNFVVLSGDVHYSFVYDVELRGRRHGPDIWQICSSGLRNNFPDRLLDVLDRLNRWLYSPRSPLNWFTSRRSMRIIPRKPIGTLPGRRLLNQSGIGVVELDEQGRPWRIRQLVADGKMVTFERREDESNWH